MNLLAFIFQLIIVLGLYYVVRTALREWRDSRGAPVRVAPPASLSRSPLDAYGDHPEPEGAAARLREYLSSPFANPSHPGWYLFARLAELNPFLIPQYEEIFQQQPSETLLLILAQCGNDGTRAMLERTADQTESLREKISYIAANWQPRFLRPLETKPHSCTDLDFLWGEYRVTRDLAAVCQIIDVLEWSDWFRGKLLDWMMRASPEEASKCADVLFRESGVVCDGESREILSRQDLDLAFLMEGLQLSKERLERILEILPFPVSQDEIANSPAAVKASAHWSLASHARQFPEIHELCRNEAETRSGRCRIALLELLARIAGDSDFQGMLNWFYAATHPERLEERLAELAPEWDRLKLLPLKYPEEGGLPPLPEGTASRCAAAFEDIRSYRTAWIAQMKEDGELSSETCTWEAEIERGERFYVRQYAGTDYDDWFSFPQGHFRAPMYQTLSDIEANDRRINSMLTCDGYLPMFGLTAERSGIADSGGAQWWYFQYRNVPPPSRPLSAWGNEGPDDGKDPRCDLRLWVDPTTARLRKAVMAIDDQLVLSHLFAAYNEPVDIFPPPFSIFQMPQAS